MAFGANPLRHQLPVFSPVPLRGVGAGLRSLLLPSDAVDPLEALGGRLRKAHQAGSVHLLGSGTQALVLALEAAVRAVEADGNGGGPAAIALPAYSCYDVAAAALAAGRPLRFYDLDPGTLGPSPESLESALRLGGRVVVVALLHGVPVDWRALDPILQEGRAVVVEDAAQAHGARWEGRPAGSHAPFGVLSFGRGKGWTGGGSGGALLLPLAGPARFAEPGRARNGLKPLWRSTALWAFSRPGLYRLPRSLPLLRLGETRFRSPERVTRMAPATARLLLASARAAEVELGIRVRNAATYREALEGRGVGPARPVRPPDGGRAGYLRFPLLLRGGMEGFRSPAKARRLGAEAGYPGLLPDLRAIRHLVPPGEREEGWPGAAELVRDLVTVPTHSRTRESEREELIDLIPRERPVPKPAPRPGAAVPPG